MALDPLVTNHRISVGELVEKISAVLGRRAHLRSNHDPVEHQHVKDQLVVERDERRAAEEQVSYLKSELKHWQDNFIHLARSQSGPFHSPGKRYHGGRDVYGSGSRNDGSGNRY